MKTKLKHLGFFSSEISDPACRVCLLFFLVGIVFGSVYGCFFASAAEEATVSDFIFTHFHSRNLWISAYKVGFSVLLILLFGTSFLGIVLIPSVVLTYGFSLGCACACLYVSYGMSGLLGAALCVGLLASLVVPCIVLSASHGIHSANQLFSTRFYAASFFRGDPLFLRRLPIITALLAAAVTYDYYLMLKVVSYLI